MPGVAWHSLHLLLRNEGVCWQRCFLALFSNTDNVVHQGNLLSVNGHYFPSLTAFKAFIVQYCDLHYIDKMATFYILIILQQPRPACWQADLVCMPMVFKQQTSSFISDPERYYYFNCMMREIKPPPFTPRWCWTYDRRYLVSTLKGNTQPIHCRLIDQELLTYSGNKTMYRTTRTT